MHVKYLAVIYQKNYSYGRNITLTVLIANIGKMVNGKFYLVTRESINPNQLK